MKTIHAGSRFGRTVLVPVLPTPHAENLVALAAETAAINAADIVLSSVVDSEAAVEPRRRFLEQMAATVDTEESVTVAVDLDSRPIHALRSRIDDSTSVVATSKATQRPHDGHLGSLAELLVIDSGRPAVVLGPHARGGLRSARFVVVPLDGSSEAETALGPAAELAAHLDADIWAVTVVTPAMSRSAATAGIGAEAESGYVRRIAAELQRTRGLRAEFDVLHRRDPGEAIAEFASRSGVVVMSTHGRRGVDRLITGSVTADVVGMAFTPTVIVPPLRKEH